MNADYSKPVKLGDVRAPSQDSSRNPLRYRLLWQGLGWAMVATVVWLSLTPSPPRPPSFLDWDKAQHALAYACLMFWYRQAFQPHWRWPVFLLSLGIGLEYLQGLGAVRTPDSQDMLANGVGVGIGLGLAMTWFGGVLAKLDSRIAGFRGCQSTQRENRVGP